MFLYPSLIVGLHTTVRVVTTDRQKILFDSSILSAIRQKKHTDTDN